MRDPSFLNNMPLPPSSFASPQPPATLKLRGTSSPKRVRGLIQQRHGLQPSKGTYYKSALAESEANLGELAEGKSSPAIAWRLTPDA